MDPVNHVEGKAYPFGRKNVDTDVIIPAHWLKTISRIGLGRGAFGRTAACKQAGKGTHQQETGQAMGRADALGDPRWATWASRP